MSSHQMINQDSGNCEWYTPDSIVDCARLVMGSIDLDPASSEVANRKVKASIFYTEKDNSLEKEWVGNIWMNHPFSRENNKLFVKKIVGEHELGNINQACCITFAATSEKWFQPLLAYPQCYIHGRTNYFMPDGTLKKGVTKGSVVTYIGENISEFKKYFSKIGTVKI